MIDTITVQEKLIPQHSLSRRMLFKSFKALQADDWLMLFLMVSMRIRQIATAIVNKDI